jgi:hypothetical protein
MNKLRITLSLIVAASAGLFALRHHSLRQLQTEHTQLEQRSEQASNHPTAIPSPAAVAADSTNTGLSPAERSELLRLRGQIGPLRQELAQATNEPAKISRPTSVASSSSAEEPIVSKEEAMQRLSSGRDQIMALLTYASKHQQRLPATLAEAAPFVAPNTIESADFEFVGSNLDLSGIKSAAHTIVLRERAPWKNFNGRWNRIYAFADGHGENAVSPTNDFTDWEAKHQPSDQDAR